MEEYNVDWMNDAVLERMLVALKDKIPIKVRTEGLMLPKGSKGDAANSKSKVDVYRGPDYQIAYYFRKASQPHAVLLKDKTLLHPGEDAFAQPPPPPHHPGLDVVPKPDPEPNPDVSPPSNVPTPPPAQKRARSADGEGEVLDLTHDDVDGAGAADDLEGEEESSGKRRKLAVEEPLFIKDEDEDEVVAWGEVPPDQVVDEDDKPDLKPRLKVNYTGYSIYNRSLVVIIEPYPALPASLRATPSMHLPRAEVRQLSQSVAPEARPQVQSALASMRGGTAETEVDEDDENDDLPSIDEILRRRAAKNIGGERG
ncbi:hypothetical protein RQP46_007603 [Phenoliferia psychrophenolica]